MILKYRATLPSNKIFMREYEIKAEMKLYRLHEFIRTDLGFAPDQMVMFEGYDKDGVLCSEYGLFDMGDGSMDSVTLQKTFEKGETTLRYLFNLNSGRYIILSYIGEEVFNIRESYPRLMAEKGRNPNQFSDKYEDFEDYGDMGGALNPKSPQDEVEDDLFEEEELPEGEETSN